MHQEYDIIILLFRQMSRVVTMKMIVLFALGLSLATIGPARADAEWCDVEIDPDKPTSTDPVTIILSGWWSNSCVPNNSAVSVIGKDIYFDVIWDYPPDITCLAMISKWTLANLVGPLLPGTYTVYARVVGYPLPDPPEVYEHVADFIVSDNQPPRILYVDANAPGANNGTSWENAYFYLQDALMFAVGGDEIRVAQGVYKPDDFVLSDRPSRGREETFQLINGVALKGGYAGFGEPDPNARDIEQYETALSGDLDGNDVEPNDPYDLLMEPSRAENSYHVVTGSQVDETALLSGCTIIAGNANASWHFADEVGGGMFVYEANLIVNDCTFRSNSARYGGGMCNEGSTLTLTNCQFVGNSARHDLPDYYGSGGGFCGFWDSFTKLSNCVFANNSAEVGGGFQTSGEARVVGCEFYANSAFLGGGAWGGIADLRDCTFTSNLAGNGGGIFISGDTILTNCLFNGNIAGGVVASDCDVTFTNCTCVGNLLGGIRNSEGRTIVTNCILWGNMNCWGMDESAQIATEDPAVINYTCIQGWTGTLGGTGNIGTDPCFAELGYWEPNGIPDYNDDYWFKHRVWFDGDYHLKSQGGRWEPNGEAWVIDEVTSPCIDAGDPMSPIGPEPFPNGGIINMGAYGGMAEASKSYFGEPPCETIMAGDINGDCLIDFKDFFFVALHWLEEHN